MRFLLTALLLGAFTAPAGATCYSQAQAEADQGLRIHSELMVIGLNCMGIMKDPTLYSRYQRFTKQNHDLIDMWERTMISHLGGEKAFHDYRTQIANKVAADAARMRPDVFCHNHASRMNKALAMNRGDLQRWASMSFSGVAHSKPLCASASIRR